MPKLTPRNAAKERHPCTARRRRAVWRQARAPTSCCTKGAAATVEAKARPSPARQGERQVCQRVSSKTPHPQGARVCEQRERVRPSNLPLILETLLIVTHRATTIGLVRIAHRAGCRRQRPSHLPRRYGYLLVCSWIQAWLCPLIFFLPNLKATVAEKAAHYSAASSSVSMRDSVSIMRRSCAIFSSKG
jgi:hypothetical protein